MLIFQKTKEAVKQAAKKALNASKPKSETMKAIAKAYLTKRECSVQEHVCHILRELRFGKISQKVIVLNSNILEKQYAKEMPKTAKLMSS